MPRSGISPRDVIDFWDAVGEKNWYRKDAGLDAQITGRFGDLHKRAAAGDLDTWEQTPDGALALLLLLDQFSRNMFRDDARAFAQDARARDIAARAIDNGFDKKVAANMRQFFCTPFMHSEDLMDQARCVALAYEAGSEMSVKWAILHAEIIRRFGRFPHRNAVLGRQTSEAEQAYLDSDGFSG